MMEVKVVSYRKEGKTVYFKIETRSQLALYPEPLYTVERRFNHFKAFNAILMATPDYLGYAIPKLPPDSDSYAGYLWGPSDQFLAERQIALENYLQVIASHKQLRENIELSEFLTQKQYEGNQSSIPDGLMRIAKQTVSSFSNVKDRDSLEAQYLLQV